MAFNPQKYNTVRRAVVDLMPDRKSKTRRRHFPSGCGGALDSLSTLRKQIAVRNVFEVLACVSSQLVRLRPGVARFQANLID
jgi:hypothetical protein